MKKIIFLYILFFSTFLYAFEEPPYITVTKPTPNTTWDIGSGETYTTLGAAETALEADSYPNGVITPPIQLRMKEGTYIGSIDWDVSGTSGNEIVITVHPDNTNPVIFEHADDNITHVINMDGSYVIWDGGPKLGSGQYGIIIDGQCTGCGFVSEEKSGSPASGQYMVRLANTGTSHITFSRIHMRDVYGGRASDPDGQSGADIAFVPIGPDYVWLQNCLVEGAMSGGLYPQSGDYVYIKNNIIRNNEAAGIQVNPHSAGDSMDEVIISGNAVYGNGKHEVRQDSYTDYAGIVITSGTSAGHPDPTLYNVDIYSNIVWDNKRAGIQITPVESLILNCFDNSMTTNGTGGIRLQYGGDSATIYFKNNLLYGDTGDEWAADQNSDNWDTYNCATYCDNNLISDPSWESTTVSSDDYLKLSASSSNAIEQGSDTTGLVTYDYFGNALTVPVDIGAHEYSVTDETAPTIDGAQIDTGGNTMTLTGSENMQFGAGGSGGFALSGFSGGAVTATYASGSGTSLLVFTLSRTISNSEGNGSLAFTQPIDGWQDTATIPNDLENFSGTTIINNVGAETGTSVGNIGSSTTGSSLNNLGSSTTGSSIIF